MAILLSGRASLRLVDVPSTFERPSELIECEEWWEDYVRAHEEGGGEVWNSSLYRFEGAEEYQLSVSSIELKEVLLGRTISHCPPLLNMFVATLPITKEGQIVLCRPSQRTTTTAGLSLIGGALSRDEGMVTSTTDIIEWGERELFEEVNINGDLHSEMLGIILTPHTSVGCINVSLLNLSSSELLELFQRRTNQELEAIYFASPEELPTLAEQYGGYLKDAFSLLPDHYLR